MAQVPIHFARMAGLPDEQSRRRWTARGATADETDSVVTDSVVTDASSITDPLPDATPAPTPKPARVRPAKARLVWGRRHA